MNNNNNITDDTDNFPPMEALNIENTLLSTPVDTDQWPVTSEHHWTMERRVSECHWEAEPNFLILFMSGRHIGNNSLDNTGW